MRRTIITIASFLTVGWGGPAPQAAQAGEAQASAVESESAFLERCTRETIASNPQSKAWARDTCEQTWTNVVAAGPMADTILAAEPATAGPVDLASLSARLEQVRWGGRAASPTVAAGRLGDLDVSISRTPAQLAFTWARDGDLVPYDLEQALRGRGATLTLVGCQSYGGRFDVVRAYRVTAPGRAPFGLQVYSMNAAVAGSYATFNAYADLSGQPPTLARLRTDPKTEWAAACPQ